MMQPTIVVPAFNRPKLLQRLLTSLLRSDYPHAVRLVIVVDAGGVQQSAVKQVANAVAWPFGEKRIHLQPHNLGLIGNIFFCAALALEYGSVILLEDDLVVSPQFYRYAQAALDYYHADNRIAGISLNSLAFNGYTKHPFEPILDGADTFLMQVGWYQGQAYSAEMWRSFQQWQTAPTRTQPLHESFDQFAAQEWFPLMMRYLVETGRTYVFPRESLTTNFGDVGVHFAQRTNRFHRPLLLQQRNYRFNSLDDAVAVYDAFQELHADRLATVMAARGTAPPWREPVTLDLNGTRSLANIPTPLVLTTRSSRRPLQSWGLEMHPMVANIIENVAGNAVVLSRREDVDFGRIATYRQQAQLHRYFDRHPISRRARLRHWLFAR